METRHRALARIGAIAVTWVLIGCGPAPDDQLDRDPGTSPVAVPDAGAGVIYEELPSAAEGPAVESTPLHDCHDACPGTCGPDEICCWSTQRCVPIDCLSCCSDTDHGTRGVSRAAAGG